MLYFFIFIFIFLLFKGVCKIRTSKLIRYISINGMFILKKKKQIFLAMKIGPHFRLCLAFKFNSN